jgi:hypothetical protein
MIRLRHADVPKAPPEMPVRVFLNSQLIAALRQSGSDEYRKLGRSSDCKSPGGRQTAHKQTRGLAGKTCPTSCDDRDAFEMLLGQMCNVKSFASPAITTRDT